MQMPHRSLRPRHGASAAPPADGPSLALAASRRVTPVINLSTSPHFSLPAMPPHSHSRRARPPPYTAPTARVAFRPPLSPAAGSPPRAELFANINARHAKCCSLSPRRAPDAVNIMSRKMASSAPELRLPHAAMPSPPASERLMPEITLYPSRSGGNTSIIVGAPPKPPAKYAGASRAIIAWISSMMIDRRRQS